MPLLKVSSDLQLWYLSNAPHDNVYRFDHSRETILFFHPLFLDSTWLWPQFQDPRLNDNYNLIAFDARSSGRTKSKITPYRDSWVDAADVGVALDLLAIPSCHVFASQNISVHAACRFALLFPEKTLSLCLCQIPATIDFDTTVPAFLELLECWGFPSDWKTVEHACVELGYLMFNEGIISNELHDKVVGWWETNFPATKRTRFLEIAQTFLSRQPITDKMLQKINVPVLIMHGDKYILNPLDQAESEAARIPNSQFVVIKGGPEAFTMVPPCATVVNRVYTTFLARVFSQPPGGRYKPRKEKVVLTTALEHLADVFEDDSIRKRKPTSLSFSMSTEACVKENEFHLGRFSKDENKAVTALGRNKQPVRKVSMRYQDQWTETGLERTPSKTSVFSLHDHSEHTMNTLLDSSPRDTPSPASVARNRPWSIPWPNMTRRRSRRGTF